MSLKTNILIGKQSLAKGAYKADIVFDGEDIGHL